MKIAQIVGLRIRPWSNDHTETMLCSIRWHCR